MKIRKVLFTFMLFGLINNNVLAAQLPKKSSADSRMQTQVYKANDVTVIKAKVGFATAISFSKEEHVIDIAVGFNGWEIVDNNNVIYLKPVALGSADSAIEPQLNEWNTNLLITTNKRQYAFDLILADNDYKANAYFVNFNYPNEEAQALAKARAEAQKKAAEAEEKAIEKRLNDELSKFTVPKNWDYSMLVGNDSRIIAPSFAYDDGIRTYLGFDNTKSIPAVFYYQGDTEMMSNTTQKQQGNYSVIIVHKTAERFILRSGEQVVGVINYGFGKNKSNEINTSNTNIERVIR